MALGVEAHITHLEHVAAGLQRVLRRCPTKHGAHAGHQFPQPVGLGDIVVGAYLEPDDRVDLGGLRRHHHDRHTGAVADLPAHVDARQAGQHDVEEHKVRAAGIEDLEGLEAVAGHLDPEPLALEPDDQRLHEGLLVLDHQDGRLLGHPASGTVTATGPGPAGRRMVNTEPSPSRDCTAT